MSRRRRHGAVLACVVALVVSTGSPTLAAPDSARSLAWVAASSASSAPQQAAAAAVSGGWTAGGLLSSSAPPRLAVASPRGFAQIGGCTFYASSSMAGAYCSTGGSSGVPQSLQGWLHGRKFYPCRLFPLPEGMVFNAPKPPGGDYMLKACFKNYDMTQPWGGQNIDIELFGQWVEDGTDTSVPGYMEEFWSHQASRNYYPVPRISFGPSYPARVGTYSYFWATWVEALDSTQRTQPSFRVPYDTVTSGRVYLHATIDDLTIDPGVEGMADVPCGDADVPFDPDASDSAPRSEGGSQRSECWTVYEHSSADSEHGSFHIRGTATWRVTVEDGNGQVLADLGAFKYVVHQRLAVGEVQPLTDW